MRKALLFTPIILGISISLIFIGISSHNSIVSAASATITTYHVDADNVSGTYDGLSWTTAYTTLQDALAAASSGQNIWVAEGIYYPDEGTGMVDNDKYERFDWTVAVTLYGGFDPGSSADTWNERDWTAYPTVLSGDIAQDDTTDANGIVTTTANISGTNSYVVVFTYGLTETAVMDGFTITAGDSGNSGGGMHISGSSPTLVNMNLTGNRADQYGGGMAVMYALISADVSNPSLTNVNITHNEATQGGAGIYVDHDCSPTLTNLTILGNKTDGNGGGMYNDDMTTPTLNNVIFTGNFAFYGGGIFNDTFSHPSITNVTIAGNKAAYGGGIANNVCSATILNSILWGNSAAAGNQMQNTSSFVTTSFSDIEDSWIDGFGWDPALGTDGGGNIDADPLFLRDPDDGDGDWRTYADNDYGDLHLGSGSPAVNTGTNAGCPLIDLDGNPRPIGAYCDMGAYEFGRFIYLPIFFR